MNTSRALVALLALAATLLSSACSSIDIDENDHDARFYGARVRKQLGSSPDSAAPHVELDWTWVSGETDVLDYTIGTAKLGAGLDFPIGKDGWLGVLAGLAWQTNDFSATPEDIDSHNAFGVYAGVEGGWRLASWFEPYGRVDSALLLDELATSTNYEAGVRFHVAEHAALFVGWRKTHYEFENIESDLDLSSLSLDASGLMLGLALNF